MTEKTFNPEDLAALAGVTTATIMRHIRLKKLKGNSTRGYEIDRLPSRIPAPAAANLKHTAGRWSIARYEKTKCKPWSVRYDI